jgi:hypothetical protein
MWSSILGGGAGSAAEGGGSGKRSFNPLSYLLGKGEPKRNPRLSNKGANALNVVLGQNLLTIKNASRMKEVSRQFSGITSREYRGSYNDTGDVYKGKLSDWAENFPNAVSLNLSYRTDLTDQDFRHLSRDARTSPPLQHLNIRGCTGITDAAFQFFTHMRIPPEGGAHQVGTLVSLNMTFCTQITDAAFVHLRGIEDLSMLGCNQVEITNAAFTHLRGIKALEMSGCNQATITNAALENLVGIRDLFLYGCTQFTDGCLTGLGSLTLLDVGRCHLLTDASIAHLQHLERLEISECPLMTDAAVSSKRGLRWLSVNGCPQLTEAAFEHLDGILELRMDDCTGITSASALRQLHGIQVLHLDGCHLDPVLEDGEEQPIFQHIQGIKELSLEDCDFVSTHDLATLLGIRKLNIRGSSAVLNEATMNALTLTLEELIVGEEDHPETLRVAALYGVTPDNATVVKPSIEEGSQRKTRKRRANRKKRKSNRR